MVKFTNSYMTNAGKKMMFGGGQVAYTRAALFTQNVSSWTVDAVRQLNELDGQVLSTSLYLADQRDQGNGNSTVKVEAVFTNSNQKQDLNFNSVGWFAKSSSTSETLIAVSEVEDGVLSASDPSGVDTASIDVSLNMAIGNATTVTVVVDPAGVVNKTVLDKKIESVAQDFDTKLANTGKVKTVDGLQPDSSGNVQTDHYTKAQTDAKLATAGKVKTVDGLQPDSSGNITTDHYTKAQTDAKLASAGKVKTVQKIQPDANGDIEVPIIKKYDSPQAAFDASKTENAICVYDMDDGNTSAVINGKAVTISTLNDAVNALQSSLASLSSTVGSKADSAVVTSLQRQVTDNKNSVNYLSSNVSNNYAKKSDVAGLVIHRASSEADADNFRRANPNFPIIVW